MFKFELVRSVFLMAFIGRLYTGCRIGRSKCKEHWEETRNADDRAAEAERSEREWWEGTQTGSAASAGDQRWTFEERGWRLCFSQWPAYVWVFWSLNLGFMCHMDSSLKYLHIDITP